MSKLFIGISFVYNKIGNLLSKYIIYISPEDYRYINIALSESNSIYIVASSWHENNERYLYIRDNEGYGFFEGVDGNKSCY